MKLHIIKYLYKSRYIDLSDVIVNINKYYYRYLKRTYIDIDDINAYYYYKPDNIIFKKLLNILLEYHFEYVNLLYKNIHDIYHINIEYNECINIRLTIANRILIIIDIIENKISNRLYINDFNYDDHGSYDLYSINIIKKKEVYDIINYIGNDLCNLTF